VKMKADLTANFTRRVAVEAIAAAAAAAAAVVVVVVVVVVELS